MKLRDYFAGRALIAVYQHEPTLKELLRRKITVAQISYKIVDEMLKARSDA